MSPKINVSSSSARFISISQSEKASALKSMRPEHQPLRKWIGANSMLKSEADHVIRRALEDHNAEFTEEQIAALSQIILKISNSVVEEFLSTWRPSWSNRP